MLLGATSYELQASLVLLARHCAVQRALQQPLQCLLQRLRTPEGQLSHECSIIPHFQTKAWSILVHATSPPPISHTAGFPSLQFTCSPGWICSSCTYLYRYRRLLSPLLRAARNSLCVGGWGLPSACNWNERTPPNTSEQLHVAQHVGRGREVRRPASDF